MQLRKVDSRHRRPFGTVTQTIALELGTPGCEERTAEGRGRAGEAEGE